MLFGRVGHFGIVKKLIENFLKISRGEGIALYKES